MGCSPVHGKEEEGGNAATGLRARFSSSDRRGNSSSGTSPETSAWPEEEDRRGDGGEDSVYQPERAKPESGPMSGTRRSSRLKAASRTLTSVKPLNSKSMYGGKAISPASASMQREKRPAGNDLMDGSSEKKKKKNCVAIEVEDVAADDEKNGEKRSSCARTGQQKKQSAKKVWEEEDEIKLLKSLQKYMQKKTGALNDMNAFFEFSKKKMRKFVKRQVKDKVRRLKKKYQINATMERRRGKTAFKTQHEQDIFLISKDIWGKEKSVKRGVNKEKQKKAESRQKSEGRFRRNRSVAKKLEFHDGKANSLQNEGKSSGRRPAATILSVSEDEIHIETSNKCEEAVGGTVSWREKLGCRLLSTNELIEKGLRLAEKLKVNGFEEKQRNLEGMMLDVHLTTLELACKKTQFALEGLRAAKSGVVNQ